MAWQPGESGNPTGRKAGCKNRLTLTREAIIEAGGIRQSEFRSLVNLMLTDESEEVAAKALELIRLAHRIAPKSQLSIALPDQE